MIDLRNVMLLAWRGWTKACPNCGRRGLFNRWFTLKRTRPACGHEFEREEGYWTGAIAANLIVTEFLFVAALVIALVLTWPDPPVLEIIVGAVALNIIFPLFFYPVSKTVWMAFDRAFNPSESWTNGDKSRDSRQM